MKYIILDGTFLLPANAAGILSQLEKVNLEYNDRYQARRLVGRQSEIEVRVVRSEDVLPVKEESPNAA